MIFHASIPADNPQQVADVIAELWRGEAFRFPPWPGAYVAMSGDDRGSTIEVYPRATVIAPGIDGEMARPAESPALGPLSTFHLAIATPLAPQDVLAIGAREGWRAVRCSRGGFFDVIELWIENSLLVEVLTDEMRRAYQANVNLNTWRWTKQPASPAVRAVT
jgi:hypothetical protein